MSISELGQRMSAHEMTVVWPLYFDYLRSVNEAETERRGR